MILELVLIFLLAGGAMFYSSLVHELVHYVRDFQPSELCLSLASTTKEQGFWQSGYLAIYSKRPAGNELAAGLFSLATVILLTSIGMFSMEKIHK